MKRRFRSRLLGVILSLSMLLSAMTVGAGAVGEPIAPDTAAAGEFDSELQLESLDWVKSADGTYYSATGVEFCANVVAENIQYMNIYAPLPMWKAESATVTPPRLPPSYS